MSSNKIPRYESIISAGVILLLCGIAAAIILPQFSQQTSGQTQNTSEPAAGESIENILSQLSPKGFSAVSKAAVYDADTLYEKIDGRAPLYTESGFEKLFTRLYKSDSNEIVTFEIFVYGMAKPENALAVYSQQKRDDAEDLTDFDFGYQTSNAIFCSLGKYYLEIIGSAQSAELVKSMTESAVAIKAALPSGGAIKTEEMVILQKAGAEAGTIKFSTDNTFSCKELTNIFSAEIKVDGKPATIYLSKRTDEKEAIALADAYAKFLARIGATEKKIALPAESARCFDEFGPIEVVFNNGNFLAGVHEAADMELAAKAAKMLNEVLKGAN
jgi:type II secretory pathway pseudopilin PulG